MVYYFNYAAVGSRRRHETLSALLDQAMVVSSQKGPMKRGCNDFLEVGLEKNIEKSFASSVNCDDIMSM